MINQGVIFGGVNSASTTNSLEAVYKQSTNISFDQYAVHGTLQNPLQGDININVAGAKLLTPVYLYHRQNTAPQINEGIANVDVDGYYNRSLVNKIMLVYTGNNNVQLYYQTNPSLIPIDLEINNGTLDWLVHKSLNATVTLDGNINNLVLDGFEIGQTISLTLKQDGTGGRTIALPNSVKVGEDGQGVINLSGQEAGVETLITFYKKSNTVILANYTENYTGA